MVLGVLGVPSEKKGTIMSNTVMGSGSVCSAIIGDPRRPAPQSAPSVRARNIITCGVDQWWPPASLPSFPIMNPSAPGSGIAIRFEAIAARVRSFISAFEVPARAHFVLSRYAGRTERTPAGLKHMGTRNLGFQNSASSVPGAQDTQDRQTRQTKPFLPFTAVS